MQELIRETPIRVKFVNVEAWETDTQKFLKYEQSVGNCDVLIIELKSARHDMEDDRI